MGGRRPSALVCVAVLVTVAIGCGDDSRPSATGSSSSAASTTSTTTTTIPPSDRATVWPFASDARRFITPEEAAKAFAVEYLGMPGATVINTGGSTGHAVVQLEPFEHTPPITDVVTEVRGDTYVILAAMSDDATIVRPTYQDGLTRPLVVTGNSTAFEGTIGVELRPFGSMSPVVQQPAQGGANGTHGPYSVTLDVPATVDAGVLVASVPDASGRGRVIAASVVALGQPTPVRRDQQPDIYAKTDRATFVHLDTRTGAQKELGGSASPVETPMDFNGVISQLAYGDRDMGPDMPPCGRSIYFLLDGTTFFRIVHGADHPAFRGDGALAFIDCDGAVVVGEDTSAEEFVVRGDRPAARVSWIDADRLAIDYGTGDIFVAVLDSPTPGIDRLTSGTLPTGRGTLDTVAYVDGGDIDAIDPVSRIVTKLVTPAAAPISLDSDTSGNLVWVDTNHDLWTWSEGDPVKVASGFVAAVW